MAEPVLRSNPEQPKYEKMWGYDQYRRYAPGEFLASDFLKHASLPANSTVIDFGAGTGRGALRIAEEGHQVTMLDFADNCLDLAVKQAVNDGKLTFMHHDLLNPIPIKAEYGFCTDVMEHIQPEHVSTVLDNILEAAERVFFQISLEHDACGQLIGEHLHLTVQKMEWWIRELRKRDAFIYYSDKRQENAIFYVSRADNAGTTLDLPGTKLNAELEVVAANMRTNIAKGYKQLVPHAATSEKVILLGGGPSLNDFEEEIKRRAKTTPVICTNGTHNWCLERGIAPNGLVVVDARPLNVKFVSRVSPTCKYLFASQCAPELFESTPFDQTYIWHSHIGGHLEEILDEEYGSVMWYSVPGGTTVVLRAVPLLGMLGWKNIDIYGFDGCLRGEDHHAYEQTENDGYPVTTVNIEGDSFKCHPWMVIQGQEFERVYRCTKGHIHWNVIGEGFISRLIKLIDSKRGVRK